MRIACKFEQKAHRDMLYLLDYILRCDGIFDELREKT
jgi:hypothetical protein